MLIQVLGTGCAKCAKVKAHVDEAVAATGVDATVEKVEDIMKITSLGVMMTPAVLIDGQQAFVGKVPSVDEIKAAIG